MSGIQNLPKDFLHFRRQWPDANFIEFVDPSSNTLETALVDFQISPGLDFIIFAKDPAGDPLVFIDGHVALLDRSSGTGEWHAENFQEFVFVEVATSAQMNNEPVGSYKAFFNPRQMEFLQSLPIEDDDEFDNQLNELVDWPLNQQDFVWAKARL